MKMKTTDLCIIINATKKRCVEHKDATQELLIEAKAARSL
jgi:hypothetical protein